MGLWWSYIMFTLHTGKGLIWFVPGVGVGLGIGVGVGGEGYGYTAKLNLGFAELDNKATIKKSILKQLGSDTIEINLLTRLSLFFVFFSS